MRIYVYLYLCCTIVQFKDTPNAVCTFETLSLRIIHPNGTIVERDIKLNIQQFNFCIYNNPDKRAVDKQIKFLDFFLIRKNHILVTYYNATNPDNINDNTYQW